MPIVAGGAIDVVTVAAASADGRAARGARRGSARGRVEERGRRRRAAPRRTARRWWRRPRRWRTSRPARRPASARSTAASPGPAGGATATGTPSTGTVVLAASIPGRWAAPPAPAMIARSPRAGRRLGEGEHLVGHAVGADDARLVGDAEPLEHGDGRLHRRPVAGRPHHDGDERRRPSTARSSAGGSGRCAARPARSGSAPGSRGRGTAATACRCAPGPRRRAPRRRRGRAPRRSGTGWSASQTVTVTSGSCWIALYLARWISVLISTWSSLASTHMTWVRICPFGSCTAIVPKFLPVLARSRMAGSSMAAEATASGRGGMVPMQQRNVLGDELRPCSMDPLTGLLPHRVLREPRRRPRHARRVLPGDRRVPRVLRRGRQRPVARRCRSTGSPGSARRPVVRVRRPLGRGAGERGGLPGRAREHAHVGARVRRPRRPQGPRRRRRAGRRAGQTSRGRAAPVGRVGRSRPGRGCGAASPRAPSRRAPAARRSGAACWPTPSNSGRRSSTSSAGGAGSRKPQIVQAMRRSWITGARPNIDARRRAIAVQPARASSTCSPGWVVDAPGGAGRRAARA